jgi:hypothetical protein
MSALAPGTFTSIVSGIDSPGFNARFSTSIFEQVQECD